MSTYDDDDNIEFDFFDEPETVEATQRRRLPRRDRSGGRGNGGDGPSRPPLRTPTGLVPLARLVGLIAIAIVVVLGLVLWIGSCQGKSKTDEYRSYARKVGSIARADQKLGAKFAQGLVAQQAPKVSDLVTSLQGYAQQEQQAYTDAQQIRAPGPLRSLHQNLVDAIQLRANGLAALGDDLARSTTSKDQAKTVTALTADARLLTASDVVWEQLYRIPAKQRLVEQGVKGVVIPGSQFVTNTDFVSARSFTLLMKRLSGASTGGTPSGLHGDGLVSVKVLPQGDQLSTSTATTIKVSADLKFVATVENSGDFQEVGVVVRLTIDPGTGTPIKKSAKISLIQPTQQQTVTFSGFQLPTAAFGNKVTVKVEVAPVAGETNLSNNSASYSVFFTLS
jgi:hypothetical protein